MTKRKRDTDTTGYTLLPCNEAQQLTEEAILDLNKAMKGIAAEIKREASLCRTTAKCEGIRAYVITGVVKILQEAGYTVRCIHSAGIVVDWTK